MNNHPSAFLRNAVDARLHDITSGPEFEQNVLRRVRGVRKAKHRLSPVFVMTALFAFAAAAVLAATGLGGLFDAHKDQKASYTASSAVEIVPTVTQTPEPSETPPSGPVSAQWHTYDANPGYILYSSYYVFTETGLTTTDDYTQYTANVEFIYSDEYCDGKEPVWLITFLLDDVPAYKVLRSYRGLFINAVPANKEFTETDSNEESLRDDIDYFLYNSQGAYFYDWSLEEKSVFSRRWVPTAEQFKERNPYFTGEDNLVWAWTRRMYGLPGEDGIAQEEALRLAAQAAQQFDMGETPAYSPDTSYLFYDISDTQQPLWLVILADQTNSDHDDADSPGYCFVTLDAQTGAVLDIYEEHIEGSIDAFLGNPYQTDFTAVAAPETEEISQTILTDRIPAEQHDYDATEDEALAAARRALADEIGLSAQEAELYTAKAEFFYSVWYNFGEEPVWHVTFSRDGVPVYKVLLDYTAAFIDWAFVRHEFTQPYRIEENVGGELGDYTQLINEQGIDFFNWRLEEKAAFSAKWRPIADQYKAEHPYFTGVRNNFWIWTRRIFSLPAETDMQQDEALAIAKEHLKLYGESAETLAQIDNIQYFYDVTEADQPQWRLIVYWDADFASHDIDRERQYMIKIDAVTGEVMDTIFSPQGIDINDIRNEFISEP